MFCDPTEQTDSCNAQVLRCKGLQQKARSCHKSLSHAKVRSTLGFFRYVYCPSYAQDDARSVECVLNHE